MSDTPGTHDGGVEHSARLLPRAPRDFPSGLSGSLVKAFAKPALIGVVVAAIAMGIGLFMEDSYRELQEMRYYGEYIQAVGGNAMSDEDGEWATVAYMYNGQEYTADVDITEETYTKLASAPDGIDLLAVVIWPEEPNEPVSVDWIDAQGGFFEFVWAYWLGIVVLGIAMIIAVRNMLAMRRRYTKGQEVWGEPVSGVASDDSGNYSMMVSYVLPGVIDTSAPIGWKRSGSEPVSRDNKVLLLVDPSRPNTPHVVLEEQLQDIQNG